MNKSGATEKVIKVRFKDIFKLSIVDSKTIDNYYILKDVLKRTNYLITHIYQFIRLYILYLYENNLDFQLINDTFLDNIIFVLTKKRKGSSRSGDNLVFCNKMECFYKEFYVPLMYGQENTNSDDLKLDATYLTQILTYENTQIITSIENNIVLHFSDHLKIFIRHSFNMFHLKLLDESTTKTITRKENNKQLSLIFDDLMNETKKSNQVYHEWIDKVKNLVLPVIPDKTTHNVFIAKNPQLYLKNMIYMNLEVRKASIDEVKLYFTDYVKKHINIMIKKMVSEKTKLKNKKVKYKKNMTSKERKKKRMQEREIYKKYKMRKLEIVKQINDDLPSITNDILNGTLKSNKIYHQWITEQSKNIFPANTLTFNLNEKIVNINKEPEKYLEKLESIKKSFNYGNLQVFPLRKSNVLKHIPIDTVSLIEIFIHENVSYYRSNVTKLEDEIWSMIFNLRSEVFNRVKYSFTHRIVTDLMSASVEVIQTINVENRKKRFENMDKGRKKQSENKKIEKETGVKIEPKEKKTVKKEREIKAELSEKFKQLPKAEQEKIKKEIKKNTIIECPYFDELTEEQIKMLKDKNITKVYCDPGRNNLLYMMDDEGNIFKYTNKQRLFETRRLEKQMKIENYRKNTGIEEIESKLTDYKSKSCNFKEFSEYLKIKNEVNEKVKPIYENLKINKLNWYTYVNTLKSEANMVNKIKETFGKNIIIILGDWSVGKQMRNFISTPNKGIKRKLIENFTVFSIDEYGTSKYCCKSGKINENLVVKDKLGKKRELHSVLTYKMKNGNKGCINRDKNSVNNMKLITDLWMKNKPRPRSLCRQTKDEKEEKEENKKKENESKPLKKVIEKPIKKVTIKDKTKKVYNPLMGEENAPLTVSSVRQP